MLLGLSHCSLSQLIFMQLRVLRHAWRHPVTSLWFAWPVGPTWHKQCHQHCNHWESTISCWVVH